MAKAKKQQKGRKYSLQNRKLKAKRQYKDTVFRMLFEDKKHLLSLYNAVNQKNYTDENALQVITLNRAEVVSVSIFEYDKEMLLDNVPVEKIKQYTKASDKEILNVQKLMNPDLKNE